MPETRSLIQRLCKRKPMLRCKSQTSLSTLHCSALLCSTLVVWCTDLNRTELSLQTLLTMDIWQQHFYIVVLNAKTWCQISIIPCCHFESWKFEGLWTSFRYITNTALTFSAPFQVYELYTAFQHTSQCEHTLENTSGTVHKSERNPNWEKAKNPKRQQLLTRHRM